jgi:predicted methyltransferase
VTRLSPAERADKVREAVMPCMEPYLRDPDVTIYNGDALEVLRQLPDESVDMCCTSPPYW